MTLCNNCNTSKCPGDLIATNKDRTKVKYLECKGYTKPRIYNPLKDNISRIHCFKIWVFNPTITMNELYKLIGV